GPRRVRLDRGGGRSARAGERAQTLLPDHALRPGRRAWGDAAAERARADRSLESEAAGGNGVSPEAAARAYRLLLRLAPRALREAHADEMEALFLERWSEARGRAPVWAKALADLAVARARGLVRPRQ